MDSEHRNIENLEITESKSRKDKNGKLFLYHIYIYKKPWLHPRKRQMRQTPVSFYKGDQKHVLNTNSICGAVCQDNGKACLLLWLKEEQMVCGSWRRTFPSSVACLGLKPNIHQDVKQDESSGEQPPFSFLWTTVYSWGLILNILCTNSKCKTINHSLVCERKKLEIAKWVDSYDDWARLGWYGCRL